METKFRKKEQPRLIIYSVLGVSLVLTASIVSLFGLQVRGIVLAVGRTHMVNTKS